MPQRHAPGERPAAGRQQVLTSEQETVIGDWRLAQAAMLEAREVGDGHTLTWMHAIMQGSGVTTTPTNDEQLIRRALEFQGPQFGFRLGEDVDIKQVDRAFKVKVVEVINLWPKSQQQRQYSVTSVEKSGTDAWKVTANKPDGEDPREWTLTRLGNILDVVGKDNGRELWVEEDKSGELSVYSMGDILKTLEVHSFAKNIGIKTEPTDLEKRMWTHQLEEYREEGDAYNYVKMRYHLQNLGILEGQVTDRTLIGLVHDRFKVYARKRDGNGERAAGLLIYMPAAGIEVSDEERTAAREVIGKTLTGMRKKPHKDGGTIALMWYVSHTVYGETSLGEQLQKIPPQLLQAAANSEPLPDVR